MVNKAVVGLLLGVGIVAVLVAGAIGLLAGGGTDTAATPTPTDIQPTPFGAGTPAGSAQSPPTSTPTVTARATASKQTTAARTTIAADEFQPRVIEARIGQLVNERRVERGLEPLSRTSEPVRRLNPMARNHSQEMARTDQVSYVIDGRSTRDRFRQYDLYGTCRWKAAGENYVIRADTPRKTQLEVIGKTMAGRPYTEDSVRRFNANETAIAEALVADWFDGYPDESKFYLEKATRLGVGVHVTLSGEVYATVALC